MSFGENLSGDDDRAEENLDTVGHRIFLLRAALGCECSACSNSLSQEDTVIPENKWPYGLLEFLHRGAGRSDDRETRPWSTNWNDAGGDGRDRSPLEFGSEEPR